MTLSVPYTRFEDLLKRMFGDVGTLDTGNFKEKFAAKRINANDQLRFVTALTDFMRTGDQATRDVFAGLETAFNQAHDALKDYVIEGTHRMKPGADRKLFSEAFNHFKDAKENLDGFLKGVKTPGAEGTKIPDALRLAYVQDSGQIDQVMKTVNNPFTGRFFSHGVKKTVMHNVGEMNMFRGGLTAGQRGLAFGRVAMVGVGVAGLIDAAARSKTEDGRPRATLGRILEAGGSGMLVAGALLTGRGV